MSQSKNLQHENFVLTEESISHKLNIDIAHPIRVFSLEQLGVDSNTLIQMLASNIPSLAWDYYDVRKAQINFLIEHLPEQKENISNFQKDYYLFGKHNEKIDKFVSFLTQAQNETYQKIKPHRRRSICQFILSRKINEWSIKRILEDGFVQDVEDYREDARVFEQTNQDSTNHVEFQNLLKGLANLSLSFKPKANKFKIVAHEMATITEVNTPGDNSPEGIHQDGSDFIVSALVLERKGIQGGESLIFGPDKQTKYLEYTLKPGEGLFQADKGTQLWHKVTSIHLDPKATVEMGQRNILGFDIDVIE